ncbi:DUF3969 family protein [Macrococcus bovicus]|uniref:DUF3969 family protein n=1 Tax=Macrococcus bovicus TaxID=69968 RepID=UPI0025A61D36|nr:DUF3969 family protein [Macrococcus bovicus]WJP96789.1 DUF3969 family protein [Macrococcus bovicus]
MSIIKINKYEKFLLLQINGCLSQILNGDMTFDDAEYFLLKPRIFEEIKKLNIRKEFLDLYEDVMLFDAFILFGKFEEQALKKRDEISLILKENIDVEMSGIEIKF